MEPDRRIRRIAVVGGGFAGWVAAVTLGRRLGGQCSIHVVESPETMTPGHAVATLPSSVEVLRFLGVEQNEFVDKTQSTYSFGTRFTDWSAPGATFWHPHGGVGALIERRPFFHFWHKARAAGIKAGLEQFSTELSMALANRFIFPTNSLGVATNLRYGLHVDTALATRYLRTLAERAGVIRLERKVVGATRAENGNIDELQFEDGGKLRADLFIDTSGARAQLIGEIMGSPYQSWSQWLPCDRIVSAPFALEESRPPYVRIEARKAGWQWRIPLQQNLSVGHVFSSAHQSEDEATAELLAASAQAPLGEPRRRELATGCRRVTWDKNVVAIGSAAGALEPLAGTDVHFITNALFNLLDHFPDRQFDPANIASYNAGIGEEIERIRDFTLLHYSLSRRGADDAAAPFWRERAQVPLPDALAHRLAMYRAVGRIVQQRPEVFSDLDWFWVLDGLGVVPNDYDPLIDVMDFEQVKRVLLAIAQKVANDVAAAPSHDSFFATANARLGARRAAAPPPAAPAAVPAQTPV